MIMLQSVKGNSKMCHVLAIEGQWTEKELTIQTVQGSKACNALKTALIIYLRGAHSEKDMETIEQGFRKYGVWDVDALIAKISA